MYPLYIKWLILIVFPSSSDLATDALDSMQAMQNSVESTETLEGEDITIELQMRDLWQRFYELGTEMIITKAGR